MSDLRISRCILLAVLAVLLAGAFSPGRSRAAASVVPAAHTAGIDLTGTWAGVGWKDAIYEIKQSGKSVSWYGYTLDGHSAANDFTGSIKGAYLVGTFQDRPGFDAHQHGSLTLHIDSACHLSFASASTGYGTTDWTKKDCAETVPIETVSNGCGGAGWDSLVAAQNYLGNTSKYGNSNLHPFTHDYLVNFVEACNLHDAGYAGAVVYDKINGVVKDYRLWSRKQVDKEFLDNMRKLCARQIPAKATVALANCKGRGGNVSFGAESRYNFVRRWGHLFFDADPATDGTQSTGPRANN